VPLLSSVALRQCYDRITERLRFADASVDVVHTWKVNLAVRLRYPIAPPRYGRAPRWLWIPLVRSQTLVVGHDDKFMLPASASEDPIVATADALIIDCCIPHPFRDATCASKLLERRTERGMPGKNFGCSACGEVVDRFRLFPPSSF
jgi:hypothetical protein